MVRLNLLVVALFFVDTAVFAVPSNQADSANITLAGVATCSVKDFGAAGDGRADDTAATVAPEAYSIDIIVRNPDRIMMTVRFRVVRVSHTCKGYP